ncbi:MAG: metal-dependent hydrolase [Gammaproteobacteria bacterium]
MANGAAHRTVAALGVGAALAHAESKRGESTAKPLIGAGIAGLCGTLPDVLEPALHPNHRQFFHSVPVLGGIGYLLDALNKRKPEDSFDELLKVVSMSAATAYGIHLLMDGLTPKGLPLIGRL